MSYHTLCIGLLYRTIKNRVQQKRTDAINAENLSFFLSVGVLKTFDNREAVLVSTRVLLVAMPVTYNIQIKYYISHYRRPYDAVIRSVGDTLALLSGEAIGCAVQTNFGPESLSVPPPPAAQTSQYCPRFILYIYTYVYTRCSNNI